MQPIQGQDEEADLFCYFIIDDYYDGKIYLAPTKCDLTNGLPEHLKAIVTPIESIPPENEDWLYFGESGSKIDFYFGTIKADKVFKYMADRDCVNFITGV